jgi:hypothetical protein
MYATSTFSLMLKDLILGSGYGYHGGSNRICLSSQRSVLLTKLNSQTDVLSHRPFERPEPLAVNHVYILCPGSYRDELCAWSWGPDKSWVACHGRRHTKWNFILELVGLELIPVAPAVLTAMVDWLQTLPAELGLALGTCRKSALAGVRSPRFPGSRMTYNTCVCIRRSSGCSWNSSDISLSPSGWPREMRLPRRCGL